MELLDVGQGSLVHMGKQVPYDTAVGDNEQAFIAGDLFCFIEKRGNALVKHDVILSIGWAKRVQLVLAVFYQSDVFTV